jgi:hypothetical protein
MPEVKEDFATLLNLNHLKPRLSVAENMQDAFKKMVEQKIISLKSSSIKNRVNLTNLVRKEGYLLKNYAGDYKQYWIKLDNKELYYYEDDQKLAGVLNFNMYQVTIVIENDENNPNFHLKVLGCDHHFYFRSLNNDRKDLQEWVVAIG